MFTAGVILLIIGIVCLVIAKDHGPARVEEIGWYAAVAGLIIAIAGVILSMPLVD